MTRERGREEEREGGTDEGREGERGEVSKGGDYQCQGASIDERP